MLINVKAVKTKIRQGKLRCKKDVIFTIDKKVDEFIAKIISIHQGKKKTINGEDILAII